MIVNVNCTPDYRTLGGVTSKCSGEWPLFHWIDTVAVPQSLTALGVILVDTELP